MMGASLSLHFLSEARWEWGLWLFTLALMAACWLYTGTRGAMLGAGLALPAILFLAHRRPGSVRPLLIPIAVVVLSMAAAYLASPHSSILSGRYSADALTLEGGGISVKARLLMWRDTLPVIAERPLLGHGPDNFARPFSRHQGEDLTAMLAEGAIVDKAHNELLHVAATTGLLGLAAYLWIFVSYFRNAYRSGGWPLLALSGGVLAYILQLQTAFTTIATGVTFWAILGVSVAIMHLQERENRATPGLK
jgi:O-antigen ligase